MSDNTMLVEFFRYNAWANQTLLKGCEALTPEQLAASAPGAYGPIYRTLEHLVDSQAFYYHLLTDQTLPAPFDWEQHPTLAQISAYCATVDEALLAASAAADPAAIIHQHWEGGGIAYKAAALLIQIIDHGIEHRTNVTTILTALGLPAPEVDGWSYQWANRERLGEG